MIRNSKVTMKLMSSLFTCRACGQRDVVNVSFGQDLLKNTPSGHVDSLPLQLALTELETLAGNLDRCRAESEEKSDMVKLINSSNIRLTSPFTKGGHHRLLLKKGDYTFA